jgi:hypothetical protein
VASPGIDPSRALYRKEKKGIVTLRLWSRFVSRMRLLRPSLRRWRPQENQIDPKRHKPPV